MNTQEALNILGLDSSASEEQIQQSYKTLAKDLHPDKGGADIKMAELNLARDTALNALVEKKLPAIVEQVEIAVKRFSEEANKIRAIESKAIEIKNLVKDKATSRLKHWRNIALVFAGLSAGAIFLGKDFPLDAYFDTFLYREYPLVSEKIDKPTETPLKKPIEIMPNMTKEEKDKAITFSNSLAEINKKIDTEYKDALIKYEQRLESIKANNEYIKEKNERLKQQKPRLKAMWQVLMFGIGIYAGIAAWYFNRKIRHAEQKIADFEEESAMKSKLYELLKEILDSKVKEKWTFSDIEESVKKWSKSKGRWQQLANDISFSRFSQMLLIRGQQIGLISVAEEYDSESLIELYSVNLNS